MSEMTRWRGHDISQNEQKMWTYIDTGQLVSDNPNRDCKLCNSDTDIDGCLGKLPGVMNACCGHGNVNESYVQFTNGVILRGFAVNS